MVAVTRDLKVTYGSLYIGGDSDYLISDVIRFVATGTRFSFEAEVILSKDTEAAFLTAEGLLVAAFKTHRQRLLWEQGTGTTRYDFNPSTNTGFDAVPQISKTGEDDTGTSATYRVAVDLALPGNLINADARTDTQVALEESPSRRQVIRVSGSITALNSNTSKQQYIAAVDTHVSTNVLSLFTGTFAKFGERYTLNDTNKQLNFEQAYEELLFNENLSTLNDASLRNATLVVTVGEDGPGDSDASVRRPLTLQANYDVWVDKTVATGLAALRTKWFGTCLPHLVNAIRTSAGGGAAAVVNSVPNFDPTNNHITASLTVLVFRGSLLEMTVDVTDSIDEGLTLAPVWDGGEGYGKDEYPGPKNHIRTVMTTTSRLSSSGGRGGASQPNPLTLEFPPSGIFTLPGAKLSLEFPSSGIFGLSNNQPTQNFRPIGSVTNKRNLIKGIPGYQVPVLMQVETRTSVRVDKPRG